MEKDYQDRVDAYIRGEMTPAERVAFVEDLRSDKELQKEYELTLSIKKALAQRQREEMFKKMRQWDMEENIKKVQKRKRLRRWSVGLSAAAFIAIAVLVIRPLIYNTPVVSETGIDSEFNIGNGSTFQYRGSNKAISKIETLISENNYTEALLMCDSITAELNQKIETLNNDLATSDEDTAPKFEYKIKLNNFELDEVKWKRVEILLNTKNYRDALVVLEELKDKEGPHKQEADSLYHLMK